MNNKFKKRLFKWILFKIKLNRRLARLALKFRMFNLERHLQNSMTEMHDFLFEHDFYVDKEEAAKPKSGRYPWGT